jgi:hypothetical protein
MAKRDALTIAPVQAGASFGATVVTDYERNAADGTVVVHDGEVYCAWTETLQGTVDVDTQPVLTAGPYIARWNGASWDYVAGAPSPFEDVNVIEPNNTDPTQIGGFFRHGVKLASDGANLYLAYKVLYQTFVVTHTGIHGDTYVVGYGWKVKVWQYDGAAWTQLGEIATTINNQSGDQGQAGEIALSASPAQVGACYLAYYEDGIAGVTTSDPFFANFWVAGYGSDAFAPEGPDGWEGIGNARGRVDYTMRGGGDDLALYWTIPDSGSLEIGDGDGGSAGDPGPNVLANGDFSDGDTGWSGRPPAGWSDLFSEPRDLRFAAGHADIYEGTGTEQRSLPSDRAHGLIYIGDEWTPENGSAWRLSYTFERLHELYTNNAPWGIEADHGVTIFYGSKGRAPSLGPDSFNSIFSIGSIPTEGVAATFFWDFTVDTTGAPSAEWVFALAGTQQTFTGVTPFDHYGYAYRISNVELRPIPSPSPSGGSGGLPRGEQVNVWKRGPQTPIPISAWEPTAVDFYGLHVSDVDARTGKRYLGAGLQKPPDDAVTVRSLSEPDSFIRDYLYLIEVDPAAPSSWSPISTPQIGAAAGGGVGTYPLSIESDDDNLWVIAGLSADDLAREFWSIGDQCRDNEWIGWGDHLVLSNRFFFGGDGHNDVVEHDDAFWNARIEGATDDSLPGDICVVRLPICRGCQACPSAGLHIWSRL